MAYNLTEPESRPIELVEDMSDEVAEELVLERFGVARNRAI